MEILAAFDAGLEASIDEGLRSARGEHLVVLGEDTLVTDGWLDQLLALLGSGPGLGMVGPMSNDAPTPQRVDPVPYADLAGMNRFAAAYRAEHLGRWREVDVLGGQCILMRRHAHEATGGWGASAAEASARARRAGVGMAVACDLFVHRGGLGTSTTPGDPADDGRPTTPASAGRPRVSLTMIVRDEERNLPACLGSVRGLFDEIVVVDTGSKDRTPSPGLFSGHSTGCDLGTMSYPSRPPASPHAATG